jgi:hypothetical protein
MNIKITHATWEEHITFVSEVLCHLHSSGFTINPTKCNWAVKETDFLGFWFTPSCPKLWRKKVDAILMKSPPSNRTLHAFCGSITFYCDMLRGRSDILASTTKLASKMKVHLGSRTTKGI